MQGQRQNRTRAVSHMRPYRSRLKTSRRGSSRSETETERFDVQFVFETVQQLVADRAVIAQTDKGQPLGRQGLMPQTPRGFRGFERAFGFDDAGSSVVLQTSL